MNLWVKVAAIGMVTAACQRPQPVQAPARPAAPVTTKPGPAVSVPAAPNTPLGKRCGNELGPSPFAADKAGRILLADFYALVPEEVAFAVQATDQISQELQRYKDEELPKLAVDVPASDVRIQRLHCFVDSHADAERVGKAWQAEIVVWGKAALPRGGSSVNIQQTVNTGDIQSDGHGSIVVGQTAVRTSSCAVTPSATLLRPEASFRRTSQTIDFGNLNHLDLPRLPGPLQLIQFTLGLHFYEQKRYPVAARFFELSAEKVLDPRDNNLGTLYRILGQAYLELPGGQRRAIEFSNKALEQLQGIESPARAALYNNIGSALDEQGKYAESLTYYQRALEMAESTLGKGHPAVAVALGNIGHVLNRLGRHQDALDRHKQALDIDKRALGEDHPNVAAGLNSVCYTLNQLGEYENALSCHEKALDIAEKALGKDHPDVAGHLNNIGYVLQQRGRYTDSLDYYRRALDVYERTLGRNHPQVATVLNNIGNVLLRLSNAAEALAYYQRALDLDKEVLGASHPRVARDRYNIASALDDRGKHADALTQYQAALAIDEEALGKDHPGVAVVLNNIGSALVKQGKYADALIYRRRALAIDEKAFGRDHPFVAVDLNNIGSALARLGKHPEALTLAKRALDIHERNLEHDHPVVALQLNNIGSALDLQGKHAEALPYYQRALAVDEKTLGKDHPDTKFVRDNLATCLAFISGWRPVVSKGTIVAEAMQGSAAEALHLQTGDWIVKYNGTLVRDAPHLVALTEASEGQADVRIELTRRKQRMKFQAKGGKLGVRLAR